MLRRKLWSSIAALALCAMPAAQGKVFMNMKEALDLAFPKCEVKRTSVYLDEAQRQSVAKLAGEKFEKGLVFAYVATTAKDGLVGTAYFDAHRVRTKREILMVVVSPRHEIARIEVLSFAEPLDYIPRDTWYAQFPGRKLDHDLRLKQGIKGVTGATMTARATTKAARRLLAVHRVVADAQAKKKAGDAVEKADRARETDKSAKPPKTTETAAKKAPRRPDSGKRSRGTP